MATNNSIDNYFGTSNVNIATDAHAKTTTLSNKTGATALNFNTGTGGATLASATGNLMVANSTGPMNYPLKPAFYYYLGTADTGITGNAATYHFGTTGNALTKLYDQGSNCSTAGTFTAPVAGIYQFTATLAMTGIATGEVTCNLDFVTTPSTLGTNWNALTMSTGGNLTLTIVFIMQLSSGGVCSTQLVVSGGATNTVGIAATKSFFSGYQIA